MEHQQEPKTARGTNLDGTAMTQAEAVAELQHSKYSERWVKFEIFDDDGWFEDVYASARTDWIRAFVNRRFRKLRDFYRTNSPPVMIGVIWPEGTITLGPIWEIDTETYNVGSYEAVSNFQNPSGNTALGKADADKYKGTIYWKYHRVYANGNYSSKRKRRHEAEFTTIKTRHAATVDLLKNNESMIGEPKISGGAQRFFEDEEYTVWELRTPSSLLELLFPLPTPTDPNDTVEVTRKRRVCNQTESDEYKQN